MMKKICCILLALCLTACGAPQDSSAPEEGGAMETNPLEEQLKDNTVKKEEKLPSGRKDVTEELKAALQAKKEATTQEIPKEKKVHILQMEKSLLENYEWSIEYDAMLLDSIITCVTMGEEDREAYPQMAKTLDELAQSVIESAAIEKEALVEFAKEDIALSPEAFVTYKDRVDFQVRRADSNVVSLVMDTLAEYAGMDAYRSIYGMNYDCSSGEPLLLSDVITDKKAFIAAVEENLQGGMWTGELYSENAVSMFFENNMEEDISWTLDYNGVTVFFNPNSIAEKEYGMQIATVPFAKYPELFKEEYCIVPDSYMVELPKNAAFYTDLNDDGSCEELIAAGLVDDGMEYYSAMGIYTSKSYYTQDFQGYRIVPYYVKTAEGENFVYLGCCSMFLGKVHAYSVNNGEIYPIGEIDASLHMIEYGERNCTFSLLTDPSKMHLDDYNDPARIYGPDYYGQFHQQDGVVFEIAANGLPRRWDKMMPDVDKMDLMNLSEELLVGERLAYLSISPYNSNPHFQPWMDPRIDDVEHTSLIINADGTGTIIDFDNMEDELSFKWYVDSIHSYRLESEEGGTFYLSCYSGEKQDSPEQWLLLYRENDGYQIWFCI